jgi:hypothetical protein
MLEKNVGKSPGTSTLTLASLWDEKANHDKLSG